MERDKKILTTRYLETLTATEWIDLIGDDDLIASRMKKRRSSETWNLVDYTTTKWGTLLRDPTLADPTSPKAKLFRRRFRMPYNLFLYLLTRCRERSIFSGVHSTKSQIPDEIKLICCLRIPGRDNCSDDIGEMSDMGESTALSVFRRFVLRMI